MKYAIPVSGGMVSPHFGHCEHFALVDVDEAKNSRKGKGIRIVAAALSATTTGAGSFYYPVTTDIDCSPRSLAEWLGEKGIVCIKGRLRDILVNTRP